MPDKKLRKCELTEGPLIFERGGGGEGRASENHLVFRGNAKGSALMIRPDPRQAPPRLVSNLLWTEESTSFSVNNEDMIASCV